MKREKWFKKVIIIFICFESNNGEISGNFVLMSIIELMCSHLFRFPKHSGMMLQQLILGLMLLSIPIKFDIYKAQSVKNSISSLTEPFTAHICDYLYQDTRTK